MVLMETSHFSEDEHSRHKKHIFLFQMFWKDGQKKIALEYSLSCAISKNDISFSRRYDLIP